MFESERWQSALDFFLTTFAELAILFVGVSFLVSLLDHFLPKDKVRQLLSGNHGYGIAMMIGAATPFCSCSTLPMMVGLLKARAKFGPVMAFLFTSPLLNPFVVALFWVIFGAQVTIVYSVFVLLMAYIFGVLLQNFGFERYVRRDLMQDESCNSDSKVKIREEEKQAKCHNSTKTSCSNTTSDKKQSLGMKLARESMSQLRIMLPYMVVGVAVGAALHGFVPSELFSKLSSRHLLIMIPLSAIIGVFLYVRASTMIPIAASLAAKGMALGAVMSLTIAGAGASLPELIMLKKLFHWPLLVAFIVLVFVTACVTGISIELLTII
ncbi:permease [Kangiella sediminilitoris]|uniref:Permease n=1 Tax=Kangiella sediminilitoris TaxID=1144748 RepID=A0A1B3BDM7_9GAMM|nr:permease [Kangiella sediminilitoris]AOE50911.1 Permease [Kangiella sediminilitoris]